MGAWSCNELQKLGTRTGYQDTSPSNGCSVTCLIARSRKNWSVDMYNFIVIPVFILSSQQYYYTDACACSCWCHSRCSAGAHVFLDNTHDSLYHMEWIAAARQNSSRQTEWRKTFADILQTKKMSNFTEICFQGISQLTISHHWFR